MTTSTIELTAEQQGAIDFVQEELLERGEVAIDGPAGSGKTTLIARLIEELPKPVVLCATTGKAAQVLRSKGLDEAITMHQACMKPLFKPPLNELQQFLEAERKGEDLPTPASGLMRQYSPDALKGAYEMCEEHGIYSALRQLGIKDAMAYVERWLAKEPQPGICIVDEASMVGSEEFRSLTEVFKRVVLVGDEAQLPPVKSRPVFWEVPKRYRLTQIHRQAEGSQPLRLATALREGRGITSGGPVPIDLELCKAGMPIIVWMNKTRISLVHSIRDALGYSKLGPQPGETLICRNAGDQRAKARGLINNSVWKVVDSDGFHCRLESEFGEIAEESVHIEELEKGLGVPFRFGYALTAHTAQGSAWDVVMIHHGDCSFFFSRKPDEARPWLYTAITRAVSKVVWVNNRVA